MVDGPQVEAMFIYTHIDVAHKGGAMDAPSPFLPIASLVACSLW